MLLTSFSIAVLSSQPHDYEYSRLFFLHALPFLFLETGTKWMINIFCFSQLTLLTTTDTLQQLCIILFQCCDAQVFQSKKNYFQQIELFYFCLNLRKNLKYKIDYHLHFCFDFKIIHSQSFRVWKNNKTLGKVVLISLYSA